MELPSGEKAGDAVSASEIRGRVCSTGSEVNLPADLDASWMVKAAVNRTVNIAPTPRRKRDTNFEVEGSAGVGATPSAPISRVGIWTSGGLPAVAAGAG